MPSAMSRSHADMFAAVALGHVTREFPNKLDHVLAGPDDARRPSDLHPVFHGSFDWHSCVHGYWMLARLLRADPDMTRACEIRTLFDTMLTPGKVAGERTYFEAATSRGFERPYGWAWCLKLAAELSLHSGAGWYEAMAPLAAIVVDRLRAFLPLATYPVREGTHRNTAFLLRLAADYAEATGDVELRRQLCATALRWYGADAACPAWGEPGGDDFLSPALIEAECMRRLMDAGDFASWFGRFLPDLASGHPETLFRPAIVSDRSDGKIAHLDGLNLSRAWCWRALAATLPTSDIRHASLDAAADRHLAASLPHVVGDYMGEHWLATFATLALVT